MDNIDDVSEGKLGLYNFINNSERQSEKDINLYMNR